MVVDQAAQTLRWTLLSPEERAATAWVSPNEFHRLRPIVILLATTGAVWCCAVFWTYLSTQHQVWMSMPAHQGMAVSTTMEASGKGMAFVT